MESYQKAFIELALANNALRFGEFTLKSGRISPYFFNVGQLNTGQVLKSLGECYAAAILQSKLRFDVLFGPAYKGIPLACTTAVALCAYDYNIPYCFNRKEIKDHGEGGTIVGAPLQGRVLIIDDVITAGTAIRESFQLIQTMDAKPVGIIVALDRQEKGQGHYSAIQEIQQMYDIPVQAIITFADILQFVEQTPQLNDFRQPMAHYREQYGA